MRPFLIFFLLLAFMPFAHAQKRVALVIGNSKYETAGVLKNPGNDARRMKETFEKLGFRVHFHLDTTSLQMGEAIRQFHADLSPGTIAAVFFAGHGAQVDDQNYILPIDLKAQFKYELKKASPSLADLLRVMEDAKTSLNLVFFDCCRNVPNLMTEGRSSAQGLAPFQTESESTLVSFATKHGMVAYDNPAGNNSLYTATLAEELLRPGIVIEETMRRVARSVFYQSNKRQRPWTYGNLLEPIYLAGKSGTPPPPVKTTPLMPPPPTPSLKPLQPQSRPDENANGTGMDETRRQRIRNARSTMPSQIYLGSFGDLKAAVSLQWLDEMDAVRGAIFPIDPTTGDIKQQWFLLGTNEVQGEIEIEIYQGNRLIANGFLGKERQGDTLRWVGQTNRGETIKMGRNLQRNPAPQVKSNYVGKIGTSDVRVSLNWGKDRYVVGSYRSLTSGKTYQLRGDNTADGFLYLDEFHDGNLSGRLLLLKEETNGKIFWRGAIFNPDDRINPVTISRE